MPRHHALTDEQYEAVSALMGSGQKIEAIKRYREITGAGLAEAKDEVERMGRPEVSGEDVSDDIRRLLTSGRKIEAIKRYRERTGAGLREAKEAVEGMERSLGGSSSHPHAQKSGCGSAVFLVLAVVVLIAGWLA